MSTRMLLSFHYLHDYNDFYLDLMFNSLHTFVSFLYNIYRSGYTFETELLLFGILYFSHFGYLRDHTTQVSSSC